MLKLSFVVELKIADILPNKFSLIFDCWSAKKHYVPIFTTYPSFTAWGYEEALLSFSNLEEEESVSAENHVLFINFVLSVLNKSIANRGCNGRQLSQEPWNSKKINEMNERCFYIDCASHSVNLCIEEVLTNHKSWADKVNCLMIKLKKLGFWCTFMKNDTNQANNMMCYEVGICLWNEEQIQTPFIIY